jgi:hypothetical protein
MQTDAPNMGREERRALLERRRASGCWPTCATHCTAHHPHCDNQIRHPTPKPASPQPIQQPTHNITKERDLHQATFTPLPGRNLACSQQPNASHPVYAD